MASMPEQTAIPEGQRGSRLVLIAVLVILCAGVALAFSSTVDTLVDAWSDTEGHTYTHGFLIVAVSLWLIGRAASTPGYVQIRPAMWALIPLVLVALSSMAVRRSGIEIGHQILLPPIVWLSILAVCGWSIARRCLFAVAYLYFAIPIWSHVNEPLRSLTVAAVQLLLRAVGIPAYFAGNSVEIPSGLFEIEDGCSGLHFLIVAAALAALYGELRDDRVGVRAAHLLLACGLAVVANWVRVFTIIAAGHLTQMQHYLVRVDHYNFGWLVFAVSMAAFFRLARGAAGGRHEDVHQTGGTALAANRQLVLPAVLVLAVLGLFGALGHFVDGRASKGGVVVHLPVNPGIWAGPGSRDRGWSPVFAGADAEAGAQYSRGEMRVDLYVAAFAEQHQAKELIGYGNSIAAPFRQVSEGQASSASASVSEHLVVDREGNRWLIWRFYTVDSRRFASGVASQLWYGLRSLRGPVASGVIAVRSSCEPDCDHARTALGEFLQAMHEERAPGSRQASGQIIVLENSHD